MLYLDMTCSRVGIGKVPEPVERASKRWVIFWRCLEVSGHFMTRLGGPCSPMLNP